MKFEFRNENLFRIVCRDVGEITFISAHSDLGGHTLDFWMDDKRYSASMKPTAARFFGRIGYTCMEEDGEISLEKEPENGVLENWRTPDGFGEVYCADPRIVRAFILYSALVFTDKTEAEINAILADVPTRAEALEWLKANRFPTEPLDDEAAWKRVREAEDAREFEDYIFDPRQLLTEDF